MYLRETEYNCIMPLTSREAETGGILFETIHKRKDGTTFYAEVSSKGAMLNGEYMSLNIVRDVSERKQTEEKLHRLAYYDSVTDLPNKKYFGEYILKALDSAKTSKEMIAILFIDLDRYKKVNDTMGHLIGDKLLKEAADRFRTLTNNSVFAARVGGDEFIFVQSNIKKAEEAAELAYNILHLIKIPFKLDGQDVHITTSIGISLYPNHGEDVVTLMKNADMSMYRVKNNGRNNYEFYTTGMNKEAYEHIVIENSLHHVDTLKIDRSFINDINSNPSYNAIIDAIIDIAKKLRIGIIAEGVETEEQSSFLMEKKCFEMQGFLFSEPVAKEEFETLLTKYNKT